MRAAAMPTIVERSTLIFGRPVAQPAGAVPMRRCPYCAQEIPEAAIVCTQCGRDLSETSWFRWRGERRGSELRNWVISLVMVVVLGGAALFAVRANAARPGQPAAASAAAGRRDETTLLQTGEVRLEIPAGSFQHWSWTVPSSRPSCMVDGLIAGPGDASNALGVYLLDDADFASWRGGAKVPTLASSGPTTVTIDTTVANPGVRYHLVIVNRLPGAPAIVDVQHLRVVCRPD
jgi:hypothetical protein